MKDTKQYSFFSHKDCEYFPCHAGIAEEDFNCLFCYCPLYALGRKCGGGCVYTEHGYKSCAECTFPHWPDNYYKVLARYEDIMEVVKRMDREDK